MGYTLRCATSADAPALANCIDAAYADYRNAGVELPPVSDGVADDIQNNRVFLAGGGVLGGVIFSVAGNTAHLMNLAVNPAHAGRGVGRALINIAIETARSVGHREMKLATHVDTPRNVALYRHLGWYVTGQQGNRVFMTLEIV